MLQERCIVMESIIVESSEISEMDYNIRLFFLLIQQVCYNNQSITSIQQIMQSPLCRQIERLDTSFDDRPHHSRRFLSIYQKPIQNSIHVRQRKYSPQKYSRLKKIETETDIVDQIKNYNYKEKKQKCNTDYRHLDSLFQRNQSSMEELVKLREQLISINIMKQLEKLR